MDKAEDTSEVANSLFQMHQTISENLHKRKQGVVTEYVSWLSQVRELEETVGKIFLPRFFYKLFPTG